MTKLTIVNEEGQTIQVEADAFKKRSPDVENSIHDFRAGAYQSRDDRIKSLVDRFSGAIKYSPMLKDHPEWSDEECLTFARKWHAVAIAQLKEAMRRDKAGEGHWHNQVPGWNNKIPYCRNLPTLAMFEEAAK